MPTTNCRRSVSDLAADLILIETRLREVRVLLPAYSVEHIDAALANVEDALTALTTTERR